MHARGCGAPNRTPERKLRVKSWAKQPFHRQPRRNETLDAAILVDSHFEVSDPCFFALGKLAVRGE